MSRDVHERARALVAFIGTEALSDKDQSWLQSHLRDCAACRNYEEAAGAVIRALRSQPLTTDPALIRATQRRVRTRALEHQERQERIRFVTFSCLLVVVLTALTAPLFWQMCKWIALRAGIPAWLLDAAFTFASFVPALAVSTVLLARGTHLSNDISNTSTQQRG